MSPLADDRGPSSKGRISSGASERSQARLASTPDDGAPATGATMRAARRRWASGVAVLTTAETTGDATVFRGATISGFQVVSLEPAVVGVFLERHGATAAMIERSGICAISVLDRAHEFHADRFAGLAPLAPPDFRDVPHMVAATGAPILLGALAWFDCRLEQTLPVGDHLALLCRVERVGLAPDTDDPLLSYEGSFRRIEGML